MKIAIRLIALIIVFVPTNYLNCQIDSVEVMRITGFERDSLRLSMRKVGNDVHLKTLDDKFIFKNLTLDSLCSYWGDAHSSIEVSDVLQYCGVNLNKIEIKDYRKNMEMSCICTSSNRLLKI